MADTDPLRPVFDAVSAATDPLEKFKALKTSAAELAGPVRHGLLDYYDIEERLIDLAHSHGLVNDLTLGAVELAVHEALSTPPLSDTQPAVNGGDAAKLETSNVRAQRIKLIPFKEIKLSSKRRYLVKGLVPRVGLCVVWGPPKSGKSFSVFDLVLHSALGWKYRGRRTQQGAVVYCSFEGQSGIEARVEAFRQKHLSKHRDDIPFYVEPVNINLVREHGELIKAIKATLGDTIPIVVVLDTLNRSLQGSESSDEDMTAYIRAADVIRETFNCAVIIVHHCGIDGTRPRGHTSLTGACDAQLSVKRDSDGVIEMKVEWMKDGPEGDTIYNRLESVTVGKDEDGETITSCVVVPAADNVSMRLKVKGDKGLALDALHEAIIEVGKTAPGNSRIPPDKKSCPVEVWKNYFFRLKAGLSDKPDSKRRSFVRAVDALQEAHIIGIFDDLVWLAGQPGQGRTK